MKHSLTNYTMCTISSAPFLICASTIYHASTLTASPSIYTLARLSSPTPCLLIASSKPLGVTTFSPSKMITSHNSFKPSFKPPPTSPSAFITNFNFTLLLPSTPTLSLHSLLNSLTFSLTLTTNYTTFTTTSTLPLFNASLSNTNTSNYHINSFIYSLLPLS